MIFDLMRRAVSAPNYLIPVETLLGNCEGSRMPDVDPAKVNLMIARRVAEVCPTAAFRLEEYQAKTVLTLDYGQCIGCGRCIEAASDTVFAAKRFTRCGGDRSTLVRRFNVEQCTEMIASQPQPEVIAREIHFLMGRALNIRQLDAGSCNGCETEIVALTNPYYDLERFGIHFVASPKHADMLLVTGPVTRNMAEAVKNTYEAVPAPRLVVAVGACGCSGGIFRGSYAVTGAVDEAMPVDGYIPGCPPTPAMLVSGILQVLRRLPRTKQASSDTAGVDP